MRIFLILMLYLILAAPADAHGTKKHAPAPPPPPASLIPAFAPIVTSFDVYIGGVKFITADILFQEQGATYRARLNGRTSGFWYRLLPWNADLSVNGAIEADRFKPADYAADDKWGKKRKVTRLHFDTAGDIRAEFEPPADDPNPGHVTDEQKRGSTDPVTALLQMLAGVAVEKNCNVTVPVFDGKRRFDVSGHDAGFEAIDEEDYSVFKGTARRCDADFKLVSGEWKDKDKAKFWYKAEGETGREPFHIWLGRVSPDLPELPVRLESGSVWGLIVVHLGSWRYATAADLATDSK